MGKRAEAEIAEVEAPIKKSKKVKALVETVAEEVEPEAPKKEKKHKKQIEEAEDEAPKKEKKEKKNKHEQAEVEAVVPDAAALEGEDADEEKRKRKEEKKKRKQAAAEAEAEASAAAEKQPEKQAPRKKTKTDGAADEEKKASEAPTTTTPIANDLTVFVGGLPFTCTVETLRKEFSKCGEISSLKMPGKKKSRGIAFITYASKEGVEKAVKMDGDDYEGRTLRVNLSGQAPEKEKKEKVTSDTGKGKSKGNRAFQVFVGGLPFQAKEAVLMKDFGECGEIDSFIMPLNEEKLPKGIAFITYKTQEGVDKALAFDGTEYGGRTLKVNKADRQWRPSDEGKGKGKDGKDKAKGKGKDKGKDKGKKGGSEGKAAATQKSGGDSDDDSCSSAETYH